MKQLQKIICVACVALLVAPALSAGPLKPRGSGKSISASVSAFSKNLQRKLFCKILPAARRERYRTWKQETWQSLQDKFKSSVARLVPGSIALRRMHQLMGAQAEEALAAEATGEWAEEPAEGFAEEAAGLSAEDAFTVPEGMVPRLVHLTPEEPVFISLEDIRADEEAKKWYFDIDETLDRYTRGMLDDLDYYTEGLARGFLSDEVDIQITQDFMAEHPFETVPLSTLYEYSDKLFAARPAGRKIRSSNDDEYYRQLDMRMAEQEEFYFKVLPASSLILVRKYIRPQLLEEAVNYYILSILRPHFSFHQKLRALMMLGFFGGKGDGLADMLLKLVKENFKDPPWTVDYAAGMALLNMGEAEKFDQLVQWRKQIEAGKTKHTPGIAWLYGEVFDNYDLYVEELGGIMPRMPEDSPEEGKIAMQQLQEVREHIVTTVEEVLWELQDINSLTDFLSLKGCVVRLGPAEENPQ